MPSLSRLLVLLCVLALVQACSTSQGKRKAMPTETLPVAQLYHEAKQFMVEGNYDKAEQYYKRLTARFPFGPYSEQAQLDLAFVEFRGNKRDDAYSSVNRFIRTYPAQKHVDYAYYLRGLINFQRDAGFLDRWIGRESGQRDPSYNLQSFNDFSEFLQRFPQSDYADDARQRMIYLRNLLAEHELNAAMYYLRRHAYVGAAGRGKYLVEHYQTSPQVADALAIMAKSYAALGQEQLAEDARRVLATNYPEHPYLSQPKRWPHFPSNLRRLIPFSRHG